MPISIFAAVFAHTDNCKHCDPSGYPLCKDGLALRDAAIKEAAMIVAPIPDEIAPKAKA